MIFNINSIFIILVSLYGMMHPVHVSITNVDYIQDENKAEISIKIFKDDFQLLFAHLYQINLDVNNIENDSIVQKKINTYFSNHFKVNINDKKNLKLNFRDLKKNEDSIWFLYESKINEEPETIEFINTILLDLYFDQKNMLIFSYKDKEQGFMFNLKHRSNTISFHDF